MQDESVETEIVEGAKERSSIFPRPNLLGAAASERRFADVVDVKSHRGRKKWQDGALLPASLLRGHLQSAT